MKKSLLITAVVLLTQANNVFAAGSKNTLGRIDAVERNILSGTSLDEVSGKMKNATSDQERANIGKSLVNTPGVRNKISTVAATLGLPQTVKNVVAMMPFALRSLLFMEDTYQQSASDPNSVTPAKRKMTETLSSLFSKMPDTMGLNSSKQAEVMNNLFENAPGLGDALLPLFEGIIAEQSRGSDFNKAFEAAIRPLLESYNKRNKDKAVTMEQYLELLKRCKSTLPS